jgi:DnaJ-class molecular chaperone
VKHRAADTGAIIKRWRLSKDATQDEIKKAYRKLARKYHPT